MKPFKLSDIPKALSDKYPGLIPVNQAIIEYQNGQQVTVLCPTCKELLTVESFEVIRTLWVTCPNDCTFYHEVGARTDE
jgi:hypothetical protein